MSDNKAKEKPQVGSDEWYSEYLKKYLERYPSALDQRNILEARLRHVCKDMNRPIGGMDYSPVNVSSGNISSGSAAFTLRKSEIESRIVEQIEQAKIFLLKTMDILDYLDPTSTERKIVELKYIDNLDWYMVARKAHRSRSSCIEYRDKGIAQLITYDRVRAIIRKYAEEIEA